MVNNLTTCINCAMVIDQDVDCSLAKEKEMESLQSVLSQVMEIGPEYFAECKEIARKLNALFERRLSIAHVHLFGLQHIDVAISEADPNRTFAQLYGLHRGRGISSRLCRGEAYRKELFSQARELVREDIEQLNIQPKYEAAMKYCLTGLHYWRLVEQAALGASLIDELVFQSATLADDPANSSKTRKPYTIPLGLHRHRKQTFVVLRM